MVHHVRMTNIHQYFECVYDPSVKSNVWTIRVYRIRKYVHTKVHILLVPGICQFASPVFLLQTAAALLPFAAAAAAAAVRQVVLPACFRLPLSPASRIFRLSPFFPFLFSFFYVAVVPLLHQRVPVYITTCYYSSIYPYLLSDAMNWYYSFYFACTIL